MISFVALLLTLGAIAPEASGVDQMAGAVSGRVLDVETGQPLPGAHVFLSQTTRGDATDLDGRFRIDGVPAGTYVLVASMVGYGQEEEEITVRSDVEVTLRLRAQDLDLGGEATVVSSLDRTWRRQLRRFEQRFFGETPRGRRCRFVNPEVLDFEESGDVFTAVAREPLVYDNLALGYRVTYVMDRFRAEGTTTLLGGHPRYEELPGSSRQRRRWAREREKAYRGSLQHFLRSVLEGVLRKEGFDAYTARDTRVIRIARGNRALAPRIVADSLYAETSDGYALDFEGTLHVEYTREDRHRAYNEQGWAYLPHQHSAIRLLQPSAAFDEQGLLTEPYNAILYGYWSWEGRAGDALPRDYEPEHEIEG